MALPMDTELPNREGAARRQPEWEGAEQATRALKTTSNIEPVRDLSEQYVTEVVLSSIRE